MNDLLRDVEERCEAEIVELHRFFEDWFNERAGRLDLTRLSEVLAPDFTMINTDGRLTRRRALLDGLDAARGAKNGLRISIEETTVLSHVGEVVLAVYEESQELNGQKNRRSSSVMFRENPKKPNGLEWIHVHETWLKV